MTRNHKDKKTLLSKYLNVDISLIEQDDENIFSVFGDGENIFYFEDIYLVLHQEEIINYLKEVKVKNLLFQNYSFSIKEICLVLCIDEDKIKTFFLADILSEGIRINKNISGELLYKFLIHHSMLEKFIYDFSLFLINGDQFWNLLSTTSERIMINDFYVFRQN